jgi:hypothetical protein
MRSTNKKGLPVRQAFDVFDVSYLIGCLVAGVGFEPTTFGL